MRILSEWREVDRAARENATEMSVGLAAAGRPRFAPGSAFHRRPCDNIFRRLPGGDFHECCKTKVLARQADLGS
jgi:hypothetical protein